jgi:hypothetical protein
MGGSIQMADIVNTLMLYDLTFNSFRACFAEIYVHSGDGARCPSGDGARGGHAAPPRHSLGQRLQRRRVDRAADVDVDGRRVPGGGGDARDSSYFVVADGGRRRRRRVRHRGGGCGGTAWRHQPGTERLR